MDATLEKLADRFASKRAGLGGLVVYILWDMAQKDPANAVYYAAGMVAIVFGFMVSEHIEKGRKSE